MVSNLFYLFHLISLVRSFSNTKTSKILYKLQALFHSTLCYGLVLSLLHTFSIIIIMIESKGVPTNVYLFRCVTFWSLFHHSTLIKSTAFTPTQTDMLVIFQSPHAFIRITIQHLLPVYSGVRLFYSQVFWRNNVSFEIQE